MKSHWNNLLKGVQKIQKKNRTTKQADSWTGQVFLVLYLNMGFELLRDSALPAEIITELDTCYTKATQKVTRKTKKEEGEDPHWLEVVTDILLSLLSRNQHLLRSIVVSVWSLLSEHVTPNALQQVLDVNTARLLYTVVYRPESQLFCHDRSSIRPRRTCHWWTLMTKTTLGRATLATKKKKKKKKLRMKKRTKKMPKMNLVTKWTRKKR